jgi:hypothetical protein
MRKGYLKNHLMNVHHFSLGEAKQFVMFSERGQVNSYMDTIDNFNTQVLKSPVNSNVQNSDISSDELAQNDSLDFGDEPDISFCGETSEVDKNNNDVNGDKEAYTDGVEVISDVEDVVVNYHRDDDANVNGVNAESENEYDAN